MLPVIPLIIYRLIENDIIDATEQLLSLFTQFLAFHPFRFSLVRDMLAYFYGHLPGKLVVRILGILDVKKVKVSLTHYLKLRGPRESTIVSPSLIDPDRLSLATREKNSSFSQDSLLKLCSIF